MPRSIRDIAFVLMLIGGGLVILISSGKGPEAGPVNRVLYSLFQPLSQGVTSAGESVTRVWQSYGALVGIRAENEALREDIRKLKQERAGLINLESENRRLRKLLDLKAQHELPALVAQVIGEDATGWFRTFVINRGSDDGVIPDMAVTAAEGIVGRVVRGSKNMSQVLLITDPGHSADCRIVRTRDRGILNGSLEKGCILRFINLQSEIRTGDEVVTSGLDGVFPKGLMIGRVESVRRADQGLFLEARVKPVVNTNDLEEVIVVLGRKGGFDIQPGLEERR